MESRSLKKIQKEEFCFSKFITFTCTFDEDVLQKTLWETQHSLSGKNNFHNSLSTGFSVMNFCAFFCFYFRKRYDTQIKDMDKKQEAHREKLGKLQQEFSKAHAKAAGKT